MKNNTTNQIKATVRFLNKTKEVHYFYFGSTQILELDKNITVDKKPLVSNDERRIAFKCELT